MKLSGRTIVTSTTQYVLASGARAYVVTYTTLPRLLGRYSRLVAASVRSIRLA